MKTAAVNGVITLPRHENVNDRIYSHYTVYSQGKEASGVCYVTEVDAGMQENTMPYPQPAIIKTLGAPPELSEKLNIQQGRLDISLPCLMTTVPGDDTLPYDFNGRTYYFRRSAVEQVDKQMRSVPDIYYDSSQFAQIVWFHTRTGFIGCLCPSPLRLGVP